MAVPKHRVSKSAKRMRRSHLHLSAKSVSGCSNCGNAKLPHRICPHCGYYNGKEVITVNQE
jgi:large subunit ribosomal protein L32